MKDISELFESLLSEILSESIEKSHAEISMSVKGAKTECHIEGNNTGVLFAANALIIQLSKKTGMSYENVVKGMLSLHSIGTNVTAESEEQLDVMKEILKREGKIDEKS